MSVNDRFCGGLGRSVFLDWAGLCWRVVLSYVLFLVQFDQLLFTEHVVRKLSGEFFQRGDGAILGLGLFDPCQVLVLPFFSGRLLDWLIGHLHYGLVIEQVAHHSAGSFPVLDRRRSCFNPAKQLSIDLDQCRRFGHPAWPQQKVSCRHRDVHPLGHGTKQGEFVSADVIVSDPGA